MHKTKISMTPLQVAVAIEALEGMDFSFHPEIDEAACTLLGSLKSRHKGLEKFWVDKNLWSKVDAIGEDANA